MKKCAGLKSLPDAVDNNSSILLHAYAGNGRIMLKLISRVVLAFLVVCAAVGGYAKTNRDAADIRALAEKAKAAWNAGDAAAIAGLWAEDGAVQARVSPPHQTSR
jgi:hypothetical protein